MGEGNPGDPPGDPTANDRQTLPPSHHWVALLQHSPAGPLQIVSSAAQVPELPVGPPIAELYVDVTVYVSLTVYVVVYI